MCRRDRSSEHGSIGRRSILGALLALVVLGWTWSLAAQERPLDAPRAQGAVGERYDGFAVVRDAGASAALRTLVDETNAKRRSLYQQRAAQENAPASEVGKIYAREIFRAAPAGTWFLQENGTWLQK